MSHASINFRFEDLSERLRKETDAQTVSELLRTLATEILKVVVKYSAQRVYVTLFNLLCHRHVGELIHELAMQLRADPLLDNRTCTYSIYGDSRALKQLLTFTKQ